MTKRTGRCLCGAVSFEATGVARIDACHCSMCRRLGAGPSFGAEAERIDWTGEAHITVYASSDWAERGFCAKCGTALFYRLKDGGFANFNAFLLDDITGLGFETEIYIDEKPDLYAFAGERHRMTGAEVLAAFAGATD